MGDMITIGGNKYSTSNHQHDQGHWHAVLDGSALYATGTSEKGALEAIEKRANKWVASGIWAPPDLSKVGKVGSEDVQRA